MAVQNKSNVPLGTVLEGKFRITREIGRGGMAAVYEAENIDIGKRVAVKVLAAELITSRVVRERFIREARAASAVRSPHICDVYDSGMYEERPFLVMELLEGESLYDMLTRIRRLDVPTTLSVISQTSRGLGKAHEANIVHRDLKPENIFVSRDEDGGLIVKLLDFGLAKFYEPTNDGDPKTVRLTREGALFGTPAYMSPEQAKGQGEVDHRSDLWALGCIVYECLTGQTVWSVEQGVAMILAQVASAPVPRPSRLRPDLPLVFDAWFQKALDRDVARRFQTAREFSDTLAEALTGGEGMASSTSNVRQQSLHNEADAIQVDELMSGEGLAPAFPELAPEPDSARDAVTPEPVVKRGAPRSSGVGALLAASVVVLGGYGAWLHWLHPAGERAAATPSTPRSSVTASARPKPAPKVAVDPDTEPFAALVRDAQGSFAKDPKGAIEQLKAAYAQGSPAPVRSLLSHATVAVDDATPRGCRVTAIGRPRPYQIDQAASSPALARTSEGTLLGWVDNHADARRRQGHVVLLDDALRRKGDALAVTPEASAVQDLGMLVAGDKVLVSFHDDGGKQPGVYVRQLGSDGRIATPVHRIARNRPADGSLSLVPSGDGGYIAVWAEEVAAGTSDLVAQRVKASLEPAGDPQRLTAFPAIKGVPERVSLPDAAVAHGELEIAFTLGFPAQHAAVSVLGVPLAELEHGKSVETRSGKRGAGSDPVLGTLRVVAKTVGRAPQPRLACEKDGCLVGWDEEKGGANVAFLENGKPQPLWHRTFAEKGAHPAIVGDDGGLAAAWYEEARLRLAPLGRDGVGLPSVVNRVSGLQPHPALSRGGKAGEWIVAWRDYEAAHLELFALKAECP
ncbi:MAG TPA: serine/threonine-protein kinase [Polyangiaceae bacterium]|nr:serine/threonine-protein kinase [Polyangiaceae bacterium]